MRPALRAGIAALCATASIAPAHAQSYYARERLTTAARPSAPAPVDPTPAPSPTPTPSPTPYWAAGAWTSWTSTCSQSAIRTRDVTCRLSSAVVADSQCDGAARPASVETGNLSSCSYAWTEGQWRLDQGQCSANGSMTRDYTCRRGDGIDVADSFCSANGPKPEVTGTGPNYTACSYGYAYGYAYGNWRAWSSTCSNSATRTRNATCYRYEMGSAMTSGETSPDQVCTDAGVVKDAVSQTQGVYTGCAAQEAISFGYLNPNTTTTKTVSGLQIGSSYVLTLTGKADSDNSNDSVYTTIYVDGVATSSQTYRSRYYSASTYSRTFKATATSMAIGVKNNSINVRMYFDQSTLSLVRQ